MLCRSRGNQIAKILERQLGAGGAAAYRGARCIERPLHQTVNGQRSEFRGKTHEDNVANNGSPSSTVKNPAEPAFEARQDFTAGQYVIGPGQGLDAVLRINVDLFLFPI